MTVEIEDDEEETTSFLASNSSRGRGGSGHPTLHKNASGSGGWCNSRRSKSLFLLVALVLLGLFASGRRNGAATAVVEQGVTANHDAANRTADGVKKDTEDTDTASAASTESRDDDATKPSEDDSNEKDTENGIGGSETEDTTTIVDETEIEAAETETEVSPVAAVDDMQENTDTEPRTKEGKVGFRKPLPEYSDTYIPRHKPSATSKQNARLWGSWQFVDDKPQRPTMPVDAFPNGDVPRTAFPSGAWQSDESYLEAWLPEAIALTDRAMQAILAEYGHDSGKVGGDGDGFMFSLSILNNRVYGSNAAYGKKNEPPGNAGYSTPSTLKAIQKRLLHSIMTEGSFIFVMGGHSAAAGHGNLFQQSYTLQVQRILEPILARLGVYHRAHNFGVGGMGTIQNAMGARSLYGAHIDILMWDSGMTEKEAPIRDLFARQGLLSGDTVPVLWGEPDMALYEPGGGGAISTGMWGTSTKGIPLTTSASQVSELPYAARYMECDKEAMSLCKTSRFNASCWIERNDIVPPTSQASKPDGQASWHPGNRVHQINGRQIAYTILSQLKLALQEWNDLEGYALPDEQWHLTADFERTRQYVRNNVTQSPCRSLRLRDVMCDYAVYAASEFTPRYNPAETSIRAIIKEGVHIDDPKPNLYDPPDAHFPAFDAPDGEVDLLSIIENGVDYVPNRARTTALAGEIDPLRHRHLPEVKRVPITSGLEPGQGWYLDTKSAPDNCDGSYDSFCGRSADSKCLLYGHNDYRGGLRFDGLSGWLIVNLAKLKHGLIFVRMEHWQGADTNPNTANWKCENGKTDCPAATDGRRRDASSRRRLKDNTYCDDWRFEFAVDGKVTSWIYAEWNSKLYGAQRVAHFTTLLDDADYSGGQEKDVEVAIRMTGCARDVTFMLSHIYWL